MSAGPATAAGQREDARARATRLQRLAADPAHHGWAAAHAGTGKTKVLIDRVLRLLLAGSAPSRILCLTYTRAAATEMRNRLARRLGAWAAHDEAALEADLADLLGRAPGPDERRAARRLFAATLEAPGGLQIATIHAFCQSVLRRFPLESGVPPHFDVLDETEAARLATEARRAVVADPAHAADIAVLADWLKEDGLAAMLKSATARPAFRDRLAREGAEAAIAEALAALGFAEADEADAGAILAEAATLPPADEAALKRLAAAFAAGSKSETAHAAAMAHWLATPAARVETFDAYCGAFLTNEGTPRKNMPTKATAAKLGADAEAFPREAARLMAVRQRLKAAAIAEATAALLRVAAAVDARYRAAKRARARLDYDDLVDAVDALLDPARGALSWVMFKLDEGIDHVLVDEAQDNSERQWRIVERLTAEYFAGEGRARGGGAPTLFVVGDYKQSIFSFQGAAPEAFRRLRETFGRAAGARLRDVTLDVSFRATETVLETVDAVLAREAVRPGLAAPDETIRHLAARAGLAGRVEVWPLVPTPDDADAAWSAPRVIAEPPAAPQRLAAAIAATIRRWLDAGERLESEGRPIRAGDVLILVRSRAPFAEPMVRALKERGVPVAGADRMVLKDQLAVRDLVAFGRFLLLPEDDLTLATVLKGPLFGFDDDRHLFPLAHGRGGASLWRRLADLAPSNPDFAAARARLDAWLARADYAPPFELYARLLEAEGGRRAFRARLGAEADDPIDEFLHAALEHQQGAAPSLESFLAWLERGEAEIKRDHDTGPRDEVRVMTVHGAKGLEAPIVFLPDTTSLPPDATLLWPATGDGAPLWRPRAELDVAETERRRAAARLRALDEYRRLLYVALTRARDRLVVCGWQRKKEKDAHETWYAHVAGAFAGRETVAANTLGLDWKGEGWRIEAGAPGKPEAAVVPEATPPLPDWARAPAPPEPAPPKPLSPSLPADDDPAPLSPFAGGDARRWRRGRLVHRLLQSLADLPPDRRRDAADAFLARAGGGLADADAAAIRDETLALFDRPETAPFFAGAGLAEAPIVGTVGDNVVSGRVDRLAFAADGTVWLLDYKTDRPPPASPADVAPSYLRQMALYRALVREAHPGRAVRCVLLWTDGPRAMTLPDALLDAVLRRQ